MSVYFQFCLAF